MSLIVKQISDYVNFDRNLTRPIHRILTFICKLYLITVQKHIKWFGFISLSLLEFKHAPNLRASLHSVCRYRDEDQERREGRIEWHCCWCTGIVKITPRPSRKQRETRTQWGRSQRRISIMRRKIVGRGFRPGGKEEKAKRLIGTSGTRELCTYIVSWHSRTHSFSPCARTYTYQRAYTVPLHYRENPQGMTNTLQRVIL